MFCISTFRFETFLLLMPADRVTLSISVTSSAPIAEALKASRAFSTTVSLFVTTSELPSQAGRLLE